ncbi:MAG: riboflavin kinase, partial [Chloroflexota bacterium]
VMGPGSAVGKDRTGGEGELRALGEELGFALEAIDPVIVDGVTVRSTAVRAALASGDVDVAATMLGRHFSLSGIVKEGDHRGAELGFPTANVVPPKEFALPADGVYATRVKVNGDEYPAATNLGVRPTFDGKTRLMEAYLLGYEGDLYGRRITVQFVRKLREETRFESADKLVEQMKRDVEDTRRILAEATAASG